MSGESASLPVRWRRLPLTVRDGVLAGALLVGFAITSAVSPPGAPWPVVALAVAATVTLAWRRSRPWVALGGTGVALVVGAFVDGDSAGATLPALVAVYSAIAWGRRGAGTAVAAVEAAVLGGTLWLGQDDADRATQGVVAVTLYAVVVAAALVVQSRRAAIDAARERASRAEATREAEASRRVAEERLRIARELHDVLGHHVAVIGVQAGVASHLLTSKPDAARDALEHVQDASRSVLTELAALVSVLRDSDAPDDDRPTPGLAALDDLIDEARVGGLDVTSTVTGRARPVPPVVDLAAYRIVQESLTNAGKHGDGRASVALTWSDDALVVETANDLPPRARTQAPSGGYGLVGIRERVAAVGGTLDVGREGTRWVLRATLPAATVRTTEGEP